MHVTSLLRQPTLEGQDCQGGRVHRAFQPDPGNVKQTTLVPRLSSQRRYRFQMDFVNSGYAILEWGLPGWGPIPGGPAGMHEVIPQSQFFRDQMVTAPSGPTARPKTTNPEEPELPPTQPPGDLPDPDLPPPTPPTTGPENPGTGTPGGVIPRIPPIPSLPPNDIPEIPFVPERPAEPGNGLEADPPVAPGTIANLKSIAGSIL